MHFADTLIARLRELSHPLCAGIDPHLGLVPPLFRRGTMEATDPETPAAVEELVGAFLDRLPGRVAIVKPQIAFFEQLGAAGVAMLERVVVAARERELLVLLDAKRGDIASTAEGYARAYLEPGAGAECDAITLNPYLGRDTLEPFVLRAESFGRGLFVLVKTSNPGSGDLQDLELKDGPVYEVVAGGLAQLAERLVGPATGWSSLGLVVGGIYPEQQERVRERAPKSLFLVPGYGAQGGGAADALRGFVAGPSGLEGGIVNSSRGLMFPEAAARAEDAASWERAVDGAIDRAAGELGEAVAR
ncbi:MAG: orotidine-5'-phosphate decarboxylase [Deltaproteobacteria bacterium]|nr:orotidine-5'-phosphate decarboxylase [Deltaproteobacteria bacterium]MBW2385713.1 orotidine-5'-phosphate decarboxylase [Deltaproteobacteria bacterium]MBW2695397.1 orotidine-5'-phosphate decarboxylase [Deltaproteobacteria bacterium]